jgi:hypothetical protein
LLVDGNGSRLDPYTLITDPDPKGLKTYGSYGSGTLLVVVGCLGFLAVMMYLPSNSMGTDAELKATKWIGAVAEIYCICK